MFTAAQGLFLVGASVVLVGLVGGHRFINQLAEGLAFNGGFVVIKTDAG